MLGAFMHTGNLKQAAAGKQKKILDFLQMSQVQKTFRHAGLPLAGLKRLEIARALGHQTKTDSARRSSLRPHHQRGPWPWPISSKRLPEWGVSVVGGVEHVMKVVMKIADRVVGAGLWRQNR